MKQIIQKCSKCAGDGKQFTSEAYQYFRARREELGISQAEVVKGTSITDKSLLSKFEHGIVRFSEGRLRELNGFYESRQKPEGE